MLSLLKAAALFSLVLAKSEESSLRNEFGHRQICGGVYGPQDAKGPFTPMINVTFPTKGDTRGEVAVIVYDYADIDAIGFPSKAGDRMFWKYMCDQQSVYAGECEEKDLGKFIVSKKPRIEIDSARVELGEDDKEKVLNYEVKETGFYCVAAQATPGHEAMKFNVEVVFQNAYGHLPGADYPLILFHFIQSMVYLGIMLIWTVPLIVYRRSVLRVQIHITALGWLMVSEQFIVFAYYYLVNKQGYNGLTTFMLVLSSFWGSVRLAYTFFMLLIVSWGYSVVHPSLGTNMRKAQILAVGVFLFSFAYSILNYYESDSNRSGSWLPIATNVVFFPFVALLAANYFMILTAMRETLEYLTSRKQMAKVQMYRFVGYVLAGSVAAIGMQLVVLLLQFFFVPLKTVVMNYWRSQWIIYDGWPNIVYCVAFLMIMILWRPNRDNMRYAMSTQLSQNEDDADEFEIGSLNGSDDDLEIPTGEDYEGGAQSARSTDQPPPEFDSQANHGLSDLEDGEEFAVHVDDRNLPEDEDSLVQAPTQHLNKRKSR